MSVKWGLADFGTLHAYIVHTHMYGESACNVQMETLHVHNCILVEAHPSSAKTMSTRSSHLLHALTALVHRSQDTDWIRKQCSSQTSCLSPRNWHVPITSVPAGSRLFISFSRIRSISCKEKRICDWVWGIIQHCGLHTLETTHSCNQNHWKRSLFGYVCMYVCTQTSIYVSTVVYVHAMHICRIQMTFTVSNRPPLQRWYWVRHRRLWTVPYHFCATNAFYWTAACTPS